jgi:demethylmenaquinone methyltransferase/2-methoxy-6-polyprenyl-1,4-benzoquinol methylase
MSRLDHSFGFREVTPAERQSSIRAVFTAIAPRYDLMNDLMSFGIHRLWKRGMARAVATPGGGVAVDLAGGTGDMARLLARDPRRRVWVCDPSVSMMTAGRGKRQRESAPIGWVGGEAEALPFADASIDLITISFGLRNATRPEVALREAWRVLKPGGRFFCLEFSRPQFWLKPFYDLYSWLIIPRLGAAVAGQPAAYHYLIESIRRFPDQPTFAAMLTAAGFHHVAWRNMSFGIACLHSGERP